MIKPDKLNSWFNKKILNSGLHHGYLFIGPSTAEKKNFIDNLISSILCLSRSRPCFECSACLSLKHGLNPDMLVFEGGSEKASLGIEDIRRVGSHLMNKSLYGGYKIVLVEEAQRLTVPASNALLKTLEEPPQSSVIILEASGLRKILPTIASRTFIVPLYLCEEPLKLEREERSLSAILSEGSLLGRFNRVDKISRQMSGLREWLRLMDLWLKEVRFRMLLETGQNRSLWFKVARDLIGLKSDISSYSSPKLYLENFIVNLPGI